MNPTVLPLSEAGRGAAGTPAAFISLVGSSTRIMDMVSPLRRLTVNTRTDRSRHRLGLVSHPGRDDRAEPARRPTRRDDEQRVRRVERRVNALAAIAHHRALADIAPLGALDARALMDE